ncbi:MAG: response regulator [Halofilum sp. (in: g-proteobacteria)]
MAEQCQALIASERDLRRFNEQLEQRVAKRTAELEQRAAQLRALTSELTQTEERERRRLAQVLHDHLQQLVVAGKFEIASALNQSDDEATAASLKRVGNLLDQSIQESRSLTIELSPPVLYDARLIAGLGWLTQWMREQHGLTVDLHAAEGADPSSDDLSVLVFQAVREFLFNVVKHAGVDHAEITVRRDELGCLEVRVCDLGCGYRTSSDSSASDRFGLFSIRERAQRLGGDLTIRSAPGKGTCAVLTVPEDPASVARCATTPVPPARARDPGNGSVRSGAIRVLVADDHEVVREGLVATLRDQPEIVGEAGDGQAAVELVRATRPTIAVLDITMPVMNGIEATRAIVSEFPARA